MYTRRERGDEVRGKARKAEPLSCSGAAVAASPLAGAGGFSPSFSGSSSLPLDARRRSERESGCSGNDPPCWGPLGMFAVLCCCVHAARGPFFLLRARSRAGVFCGRSRGRRPDGKEEHLSARSPSEWFLLLDAAFHARAKAGSVSVSDAGSSYIIGSSLLFVSVRLCFAHRPSACLSVCTGRSGPSVAGKVALRRHSGLLLFCIYAAHFSFRGRRRRWVLHACR